MEIASELQSIYYIITNSKYNKGHYLTELTFYAAATGYIVGCTVKWINPALPILPLGCAPIPIYGIPIALGCGFIAGKIANLIHEGSEFFSAGAFLGFLGGTAVWCIGGSLTFSAKPVLSTTILALTFTVTMIADFVFHK